MRQITVPPPPSPMLSRVPLAAWALVLGVPTALALGVRSVPLAFGVGGLVIGALLVDPPGRRLGQ